MKLTKMKKVALLLLLIISGLTSINAQSHLPEKYGIVLGGGIGIPIIDSYDNSEYENWNRPGYLLSAEARLHFTENVACGFKYDYIRSKKGDNKMHVNFIAPEIVLRYNFDDSKKGVYFSIAPGYMDYEQKLYISGSRYGQNYQKGYFAIDFGLGYEFNMYRNVNGIFKLNFLTADWGVNPNGRLFNPDPDYDDGENHNWFKNDITFINLGFALQFGK